MSQRRRCIILIIRVRSGLAVILVWIICGPRQSTGGGSFYELRDSKLVGAKEKWHRNALLLISGLLRVPSSRSPIRIRELWANPLLLCPMSCPIGTLHVFNSIQSVVSRCVKMCQNGTIKPFPESLDCQRPQSACQKSA
jgi:hypothetical protein